MLNTLDYSNHNSLVDFNSTFSGNNLTNHANNNLSLNSSKQNLFFHHQPNLMQQQHQQIQMHHPLNYQPQNNLHQQQQVLNQNQIEFTNSQVILVDLFFSNFNLKLKFLILELSKSKPIFYILQ